MKYILNDVTYSSKKVCMEYVNEIRKKDSMTDDDKIIIFELLKKHSKYDSFFKNQLKHDNHNSVDNAIIHMKGNTQKSFYVINKEDYVVPFSYRKCFNPTSTETILQSFRETIEEQIRFFRRLQFSNNSSLICELCNKIIYNNPDSHVDHIYKFKDMINDFCEKYNLNREDIEEEQVIFNYIVKDGHIINEKYDGNDINIRSLKDKEILNNWLDFHKENAQLRIICKKCNLKNK